MCMKAKCKHGIACAIIAALFALISIQGGYMLKTPQIVEAKSPSQTLVAEFRTYYGESTQNRKDNIALASRKIDGSVLYPEDEFSFNDCVGARTESNGFKSAYIIQDGQFVDGVGGGVCQVSSTLYNCALLAGLAVTCVRAHSLAVSYVAPSFDAMVSSSNDLRFVNTSSAPITIRMSTDGQFVYAKIYGIDKYQIKRKSQTIETLSFDVEYRTDTSLKEGEEVVDTYGKEGLRSKGYLEYYENGKLAKTVLIRSDTYLPQKRIILRGATKSSY